MSEEGRFDGLAETWQPRLGLALKAAGMVLLVALVVPFVIYAFPALAGAEGSYVVLSGSMEPAISPGDVVFVYAVDPTTIAAGDVVTYSREGTSIPTTHRVIEVIQTDDVPSGVLLRTAGDANEDPDQALVAGSAVFGVVPTVSLPTVGPVLVGVPYMGHIIQFANTPLGFLVLVGLPLGAFILNEVWVIARGGRESATEETAAQEIETVDAEATAVTGTPEVDSSTGTVTEPPASTVDPAYQGAGDGMVSIDQTDLRVAIAVLGVVSVYTIWVAYSVLEPWSVSAAVAAGGSFLYLAALQYRAKTHGGVASVPGSGTVARSVPDGGELAVASDEPVDLPTSIADAPVVPVHDLEELRARLGNGATVEPETGTMTALYVENDGVVYTYEASQVDPSGRGSHEEVEDHDS